MTTKEYVQGKVVDFFDSKLFPAYEESRKRSGFRWDTLERRGGSKDIPDISIKAMVGNAYGILGKLTGKASYKQESSYAVIELMDLQQADGRWENPYKIPESSLEDAFTTADAVWFLSRCEEKEESIVKESAKRGAIWLRSGKVGFQNGIPPNLPVLESLIQYKQANHVGTICRALVATKDPSFVNPAQESALRLCDPYWMTVLGTWGWDKYHLDTYKTVYHDLTIWGLSDVFQNSEKKDQRLVGPLVSAFRFVMNILPWDSKIGRSPDLSYWEKLTYENMAKIGLYPALLKVVSEEDLRPSGTGYSGLITLVKFLEALQNDFRNHFGLGSFSEYIRAEIMDLVLSILDRFKRTTIGGSDTYSVERRLEVLRGLVVFLEWTFN